MLNALLIASVLGMTGLGVVSMIRMTFGDKDEDSPSPTLEGGLLSVVDNFLNEDVKWEEINYEYEKGFFCRENGYGIEIKEIPFSDNLSVEFIKFGECIRDLMELTVGESVSVKVLSEDLESNLDKKIKPNKTEFDAWSNNLRARFQKEKDKAKKMQDNFDGLIHKLKNFDIFSLSEAQEKVLWKDSLWELIIKKDNNCISYKILRYNRTFCWANVYKEKVEYEFSYRGDDEEKKAIMKAFAKQVDMYQKSEVNEQMTSPKNNKSKDIDVHERNPFLDVQEFMIKLLKEKEWMTDNEEYLLNTSYTKDIAEFTSLLEGMSEEEKADTKHLIQQAKTKMVATLKNMEDNIKERKYKKVEQRVRIVDTRE